MNVYKDKLNAIGKADIAYTGKPHAGAKVFIDCDLRGVALPAGAVVVNCMGRENRNDEAQALKKAQQAKARKAQDALIKSVKDKKVKP